MAPLIDEYSGESPLTVEYPGKGFIRFNAAIRVAIKRYNHAVTWANRHFIIFSLISIISKKYESNFKEISKLHLLVVIYECTSGQRKHSTHSDRHSAADCWNIILMIYSTLTRTPNVCIRKAALPIFPTLESLSLVSLTTFRIA